ncbi:MAG: TIR domain-containing protein [Candidatus Hermodarchaeota archaeon]
MMLTRNKIGLVFLINFILPLQVLLYYGFFTFYLDYAMNLSFLSFLLFASKDLETDKREFKGLKFLKIIPVILYIYFTIIQVGYPFIHMVLGYSFDPFFFRFIQLMIPDYYFLMRAIYYGFIFLLIFVLMLFGFKNRKYYGNYIIAFAVLYLVDTIFGVISSLTLSYNEVSYNLFLFATFILTLISASYLVFFGQRMRTVYFTLSGIMFFGSTFFRLMFFFLIYIAFRIEIYSFIALVVSLIGVVVSSRFIELGNTFKRGIRVFITHAVDDYSKYRINDIAQFLEKQKGIRYVYYCEADLTGNIDAWMAKTVPRCQLLIFMSTEKSLNSTDCATELNLARETGLTIIPILGVGLSWDDLKKLEVHREIGTSFDPMEFEEFCSKLFEQIQIFRKSFIQIADSDQVGNKKND